MVFQDKEMTKAFLSFCKKIFSEEYALFYLAVEKYRSLVTGIMSPSKSLRKAAKKVAQKELLERAQIPRRRRRTSFMFGAANEAARNRTSVDEIVRKANHLYETYVKPGAYYEISLPLEVRRHIRGKIENNLVTPDLFDEAQKHTFQVLLVDVYPKYKDTVPKALFTSPFKKKRDNEYKLRKVLSIKDRLKDFMKFTKSIHSDEYLEFYVGVERFRNRVDNERPLGVEEETEDYSESESDVSGDEDSSDTDYEVYANDLPASLSEMNITADSYPSASNSLLSESNLSIPSFTPSVQPLANSPQGLHVKSILKKKTAEQEADEERMRLIRDRDEALAAKYLERLKRGEDLVKYNARRKPVKRRFRLSEDCTELLWGPSGADKLSKSVNVADVVAMYHGPFSSRFAYFDCSVGKSWMCIVIEFEDRTFDIVCDSVEQLDAWFLGLQAVAPLNPTFTSRGALMWSRANMKIDRLAWFSRSKPSAIWGRMLLEARKAVREGSSKSG